MSAQNAPSKDCIRVNRARDRCPVGYACSKRTFPYRAFPFEFYLVQAARSSYPSSSYHACAVAAGPAQRSPHGLWDDIRCVHTCQVQGFPLLLARELPLAMSSEGPGAIQRLQSGMTHPAHSASKLDIVVPNFDACFQQLRSLNKCIKMLPLDTDKPVHYAQCFAMRNLTNTDMYSSYGVSQSWMAPWPACRAFCDPTRRKQCWITLPPSLTRQMDSQHRGRCLS